MSGESKVHGDAVWMSPEYEPGLVSVIIPTYNRAHLITNALESVRQQTYRPIELIVVDDGSEDGTLNVVKRWIDANQEDAMIASIVVQDNAGASAARNKGIRLSKGEYIAFLDSDDRWLPGKLMKQIQTITKSELSNLGAVTCGVVEINENGKYRIWTPRYRGPVLDKLLAQRRLGIGPPYILCKREIFCDGGVAFDPKLPSRQDHDFGIQLLMKYQLDYVPEPLLVVRHHSGERVYSPRRSLEASRIIEKKHNDLLSRHNDLYSMFLLRVAWTCLALGEWAMAREYTSRARRKYNGLTTNLWWILSMLGSRGHMNNIQKLMLRMLIFKTFGNWYD